MFITRVKGFILGVADFFTFVSFVSQQSTFAEEAFHPIFRNNDTGYKTFSHCNKHNYAVAQSSAQINSMLDKRRNGSE